MTQDAFPGVLDSTLLGSTTALAESHDLALLDLDGVVYLGSQPVSGAVPALSRARSHGMRLAFVTNSAVRTPAMVSAHLTGLGIPATEDEVVTSAMAAASLLARRLTPGDRVLVVGAEGLRWAVRERGLVPVSSMTEGPSAVVQGYDPTTDERRLLEAVAAVRAGLPWVATNTDLTVPTPAGRNPGNGAMVARVSAATGAKPVVAGKPKPTLFHEVVERYHARRPLVVGDRLDTDLEGARAAGIPGLLVLTGVSGVQDVLDAEPVRRPHFVGRDLGALLQEHPAPEPLGNPRTAPWRCRDAVVVVTAGEPRLVHAGAEAMDVVRAACGAWWAWVDGAHRETPASVPPGAAMALAEAVQALQPAGCRSR